MASQVRPREDGSQVVRISKIYGLARGNAGSTWHVNAIRVSGSAVTSRHVTPSKSPNRVTCRWQVFYRWHPSPIRLKFTPVTHQFTPSLGTRSTRLTLILRSSGIENGPRRSLRVRSSGERSVFLLLRSCVPFRRHLRAPATREPNWIARFIQTLNKLRFVHKNYRERGSITRGQDFVNRFSMKKKKKKIKRKVCANTCLARPGSRVVIIIVFCESIILVACWNVPIHFSSSRCTIFMRLSIFGREFRKFAITISVK